jgi:hypothetical protein
MISIPSLYNVQIHQDRDSSPTTSSTKSFRSLNLPKYINGDHLQGDGGYLLNKNELWSYQKQRTSIQLGSNILDIDFDDNMLLSLTMSGEIIVWQGDLYQFCTIENVEEYSRLLHTITNFVYSIETNYMICFKGSVGLFCILTNYGKLFLIKVDIDLSISLDYEGILPFIKYDVEIESCAIWGDEIMFLVYVQTNEIIVIVKIDLTNSESPYSEYLRYTPSSPITCLCHESKSLSVYGDCHGGITLWNISSSSLLSSEPDRPHSMIEKVLTVHSFISSSVSSLTITENEQIIWIGGSDGTIVSAFINIQKDNPIVIKLCVMRIHSLGSYSTFLHCYPLPSSELLDGLSVVNLRLLSKKSQLKYKESFSQSQIVSICSITGEISFIHLNPLIDSVMMTYPLPTVIKTIPPSSSSTTIGILPSSSSLTGSYLYNIDLVLYLPYQQLLLVCYHSSLLSVWDPVNCQFIQLIDFKKTQLKNSLLDAKITNLTLYSEEVISGDGENYFGNILIGLSSGKVWILTLQRKISQVVGDELLSSQNVNRYSVLDMLESMSIGNTRSIQRENQNQEEQTNRGNDSYPSFQDDKLSYQTEPDDDSMNQTENHSVLAYQISCSCVCPEIPPQPIPNLTTNSKKAKQNKAPPPLFPPIPVTDIFISSFKSILCSVHSRSFLSIYSLRSAQMIRYINLNSSDHVIDICSYDMSVTMDPLSSQDVEEQLIIGILGKERMKIFDTINGSILYDILTCELPMIPSTEKILFSQIISLRNEANSTVGKIMTPAAILLTSPGNLYFIPNLINPRPIQILDGERFLQNEEGDGDKTKWRTDDHLYAVPTKINHYYLPLMKTKSIFLLQTFRVLIILLIDSSKQFPQMIKMSKINLLTKFHQRILLSYPIEMDWKNELFKVAVVMSDGSVLFLTI